MPQPFTAPRTRRFAVALVLGTAGLVPLALAQTPPGATVQDVAGAVQGFYDRTQTLTTQFRQRYHSEQYDTTDESRGQLRIRRPGQMRFDYAEPNGQVIVATGERILLYEPPEEGETRGQVVERQLEDDQLPQALSFLTGTGRLDRDYRLRLLDASRRRFEGQILELRPRRESPHYSRIQLYIDWSDGPARGRVLRMIIIDHDGNRNRFDFRNLEVNPTITDDVFEWTPPPNTRRVTP